MTYNKPTIEVLGEPFRSFKDPRCPPASKRQMRLPPSILQLRSWTTDRDADKSPLQDTPRRRSTNWSNAYKREILFIFRPHGVVDRAGGIWFASFNLRISRQRAYCVAFVASASSSSLSQKRNQSTVPPWEAIRDAGFVNGWS